jgi:arginyl-tRNA--protein-N-Asp/Glu arginylyltransferase
VRKSYQLSALSYQPGIHWVSVIWLVDCEEGWTRTPSEIPDRVAITRRALEQMHLLPGPEHRCAYLADQQSRDVAFQVRRLPSGVYQSLMELNFRRSGRIIYRTACPTCEQCQAIRVPVARFKPDRSQRRCVAANRELSTGLCPPVPTAEKHALYRRYLQARHNRQMDDSWGAFRDFLYTSPVDTLEVVYRRAGRLVGVGILDFDGEAASTVYCYFDPDDRGSLGTFNVLWTIDYCRLLGIPWVYLGYYIRDCGNMSYKLRFRPNEVLAADGAWSRPFVASSNPACISAASIRAIASEVLLTYQKCCVTVTQQH